MEKIYNIQQIRDIEQEAFNVLKIPEDMLMQRAGRAAFTVLQQHYPNCKNIAVLCGAGNNGGDGYVVAALAKGCGLSVQIIHVGLPKATQVAAFAAFEHCQMLSIPIIEYDNPQQIKGFDIIVDALLGIGLKGVVRGLSQQLIQAVNAERGIVLAIDTPSGLDVDKGIILGDAIRAHATVTFIGKKIGMLTGCAPEYCGEIYVDNLQLAPEVFAGVASQYQLIEKNDLNDFLVQRRRDAHKGNFGHVLVVGGDLGYAGAARLAGEAAMRTGAGLVSVATRPEHVSVIAAARPELMAHGIEKPEALQPLLDRATVVILGPGLGRTIWSDQLWKLVMKHPHKPMVIDADALNALSNAPMQNDLWILTPHPGEAGRLLHRSSQEINVDRFYSARAIQQRYGGSVVLKGAGTLVVAPGGHISICPYGNPGMASGGMGDVLSGVIGGLLAQGIIGDAAARLGVLIHALAADHAAMAGERGLLASDVIASIRHVVNDNSIT